MDADPSPARPKAILDTQVLLDWLVFDDPSVRPLVQAIEGGDLHWVAEAGGLAELRHVARRHALAAYSPDHARIEAALAAHCHELPTPATTVHGLICRDPDDQRFIDLALACHARWLFSRDRAVLALAKRARPKGLEILKPAQWKGA